MTMEMEIRDKSGDICQPDNSSKSYNTPYNRDIDRIAGRTIRELYDSDNSLLIFPDTLGQNRDGIDSLHLLTKKRHNDEEVTISTGNLMGFVGTGSTQITIYSRFAKFADDTSQDYFLHYMLQRVCAVNLFDMKYGMSQDTIFDFLLYLFPYHLKRAVQQGIFRQYRTRLYNDANIKGPIDIPRHIRCNIPFNGRIAYRTREYVCDNPITQLIRHTIEYIRQNPAVSSILFTDKLIRDAVSDIVAATPSYSPGARQRVLTENLRPVHHPYFLSYLPLQRLCIHILQHRRMKFSNSDNRVYGILFDGAWLWEEYLYKTVFARCGFLHPRNKTGAGGIYLFEKDERKPTSGSRYPRYPDYYKKGVMVLDAKYKHLDNNLIDRDDIHQIISYMHVEEIQTGGFIYPKADDENRSVSTVLLGSLRGYGGTIWNIGIPIPGDCQTYNDFVNKMKKTEDELVETIEKIAIQQ